MSLEVKGGVELRDDVARMSDLLRASGGNGTRACNYILQTAAQPVLTRMLHNASTDPKRRSGTLYNSIRIGRVVKKRSGGYRVTVAYIVRTAARSMPRRSNSATAGRNPRRPIPLSAPPSMAAWTKPTRKPNNCSDRPSTHEGFCNAANTAKEEFPPCPARLPRPPYRLRWV